jgi:hypothetical protein
VAVTPSGIASCLRSFAIVDLAFFGGAAARRFQHGPEAQLGGLADERQHPLLVLDTRQLHHDRVALDRDLGLGHADRVHSGLDDRLRLLERLLADLRRLLTGLDRLQDD